MEYDEDEKPLRLDTVVLSAQHNPEKPMDELCWELTDKVLAPALQALPPDEDTKIPWNPSGRFVLGGPEADTGLTGRKLMVDSYGTFVFPRRRFSEKDPTKKWTVPAHIAARYIAKNPCSGGPVRKMPSHPCLCHRESRNRSWWRWIASAPALSAPTIVWRKRCGLCSD